MVHFHTAKHSNKILGDRNGDYNLMISIETPEKSVSTLPGANSEIKQIKNRYNDVISKMRDNSPHLRLKGAAESILPD